MLRNYTAKYTKIDSGYMGQFVEWPEVVTEGKDLEECRAMLRDALQEMILAYQEQGNEIPPGNCLIEQVPVEVDSVGYTIDNLQFTHKLQRSSNNSLHSRR